MNETILVVDDEESICLSLKGILSDEGYEALTAQSGEECLDIIEEELPSLVLLDIWLPGIDGIETLKRIKSRYPKMQVIMISGHGSVESAVTTTKLGAFDFIEKPLSLDKIVLVVNHALDIIRLEEENKLLKDGQSHEIDGNSKAIIELKEMIQIISPTNAWILIMGENGTGKELVARSIHRQSNRSDKPFIEVNCAAIPEELIESELFGHEKGAFTGATEKKKGKFDLANKGTIFLDEVADMSLKAQAKILRILQEKKFERVGGTRIIDTDVRVLAATNKNLEYEMEKGRFRQDLYYRLNVIPLEIPPLRDRIEDVSLLADHFIREFSLKESKREKHIAADALKVLVDHTWPGNVRELKNIIERLVITSPSDIITADDMPPLSKENHKSRDSGFSEDVYSFKGAREIFEKDYLVKKLVENNWNVKRTAESIGLERSNLHKKIKAYGLSEMKEKL
ncbi:MAG: sigma-54 dependent transcriptional regulator [Thermodesulfobacteriota bacterium]|nr:sigma-54 dependent transcriptional regulator [Thermodesulfobacteriota bacterium]